MQYMVVLIYKFLSNRMLRVVFYFLQKKVLACNV